MARVFLCHAVSPQIASLEVEGSHRELDHGLKFTYFRRFKLRNMAAESLSGRKKSQDISEHVLDTLLHEVEEKGTHILADENLSQQEMHDEERSYRYMKNIITEEDEVFPSENIDFQTSLGKRAVEVLKQIHGYVNGLAIVILSRGNCGLSTCTTQYLVAMATADLLVIITEVILRRINDYYFNINFLWITPVCSVRYALLRAALDCSVWFTVAFSFDRYVAICCHSLKLKYCTRKTAVLILSTIGILLCLKNIPIYFRFEPRKIIENVPWYCSNKQSYFTDPRWIGFRKFEKILTPLIPFGLILLVNALTVRHILLTSRIRKGLRGESKGENHSDPEIENRMKSIILLFTIPGSFLLLWLVYLLYFFDAADGLDDDSFYNFEKIAYMLRDLNCCTNTFIYVATQSKFREQLKSVVKYPVTSIAKLINN
ncbi:putative G-protein coupled receptor 139 [Mustelus asterias]